MKMTSGAPGIVLAATTVSFANHWYHNPSSPNWRIPVAGGLFAIGVAGFADLSPQAATGFAVIALITVLVTPTAGGESPVGTLSSLAIAQPSSKVPTQRKGSHV